MKLFSVKKFVQLTLLIAGGLQFSSPFAQSVTHISAPYAVVGKPALFVVSGIGFPSDEKSQFGMKFLIQPPHRCDQALRTAPVTAVRYEFSCVFSEAAERVSLVVYNRTRQATQRLSRAEFEVLAADPQVTGVRVYSSTTASTQARVMCLDARACLTLHEPWQAEREVLIEVSGTNLPKTLKLDWSRCPSAELINESYSQSIKRFRCLSASEPSAPLDEKSKQIKLLSSPRIEDSILLFSSRIQL